MAAVIPLLIFAITYLLLAIGRLPGLALDRTGFAILGAVAFLTLGGMTLEQARQAVDTPTVVVLFAMMLLSAQYELSGLYGRICDRLARLGNPRQLLAGTLLVSAGLAAILTNDVIALSLTPLVGKAVLRRGLPPEPFLLAIALGTNFGSALTPIGNPQNILISQKLGLGFLPFLAYSWPPVVASLALTHLGLARKLPQRDPQSGFQELVLPSTEGTPYDPWQARKALLLTGLTILLFLSPVESSLAALAIAGIILTSRRMHTRTVLGLVDWHLLALFVGLFVVTEGLDRSGWTDWLSLQMNHLHWKLSDPSLLVPGLSLLGVVIGNVPAVMLLLHLIPPQAELGYLMALVSTFVGNAVLVGSVANLIVAEQATRLGIPFGFRAHLKVGLPITLLSFAVLVLYIWIRS